MTIPDAFDYGLTATGPDTAALPGDGTAEEPADSREARP
jgi:hypothetical protein